MLPAFFEDFRPRHELSSSLSCLGLNIRLFKWRAPRGSFSSEGCISRYDSSSGGRLLEAASHFFLTIRLFKWRAPLTRQLLKRGVYLTIRLFKWRAPLSIKRGVYLTIRPFKWRAPLTRQLLKRGAIRTVRLFRWRAPLTQLLKHDGLNLRIFASLKLCSKGNG